MKEVRVGSIRIGSKLPLALIAGPCVLEDEDTLLSIAERLKKLTTEKSIPFIFKASYEKDNRSRADSYRGPGLEKGLRLLEKVKKEFGVPVISDVHRESDVEAAAEALDIVQIPAFLCQQTSLLLAAGSAGKPVNIKKGQFLSPYSMRLPVEKVASTGNTNILCTERGTSFGYDTLVADMCSIPIMKSLGYPVIFDATHIVRVYGVPSKDPKGGHREYVPYLVRAAVAAGCDGLFIETHCEPARGLCDAASMLPLEQLPQLIDQAAAIHELVKNEEDPNV